MPMKTQEIQVFDQQLPPSTQETTLDYDLEKTGISDESVNVSPSISMSIPETETLDIEHVLVQDDPRKWSPLRKVSCSTY